LTFLFSSSFFLSQLKVESEQLREQQVKDKAEKHEKHAKDLKERQERSETELVGGFFCSEHLLTCSLTLLLLQQEQHERQRTHRSGYIKTKAGPPLFYLPKKHTPETEKLLQESKEATLVFRPALMARSIKAMAAAEKPKGDAAEGEAEPGQSDDVLGSRIRRAEDKDDSDDDGEGVKFSTSLQPQAAQATANGGSQKQDEAMQLEN